MSEGYVVGNVTFEIYIASFCQFTTLSLTHSLSSVAFFLLGKLWLLVYLRLSLL